MVEVRSHSELNDLTGPKPNLDDCCSLSLHPNSQLRMQVLRATYCKPGWLNGI